MRQFLIDLVAMLALSAFAWVVILCVWALCGN